MKVIVSKDCGNSPKNLFVQKLAIAFVKQDAKYILSRVTDDICWRVVGDRTIQGKGNLIEYLAQRQTSQATELDIHHALTHGKTGAVNGVMKLKSGETYTFCNVYEFNSAQATHVKEITSYEIKNEKGL